MMMLERDAPDREIKIFDTNMMKGDALRQRMREDEAQTALEEEEWENTLVQKGFLKMMAENEKDRRFQNKRYQEFLKFQKQKVHSRTIVRVQFPDGMILQA